MTRLVLFRYFRTGFVGSGASRALLQLTLRQMKKEVNVYHAKIHVKLVSQDCLPNAKLVARVNSNFCSVVNA